MHAGEPRPARVHNRRVGRARPIGGIRNPRDKDGLSMPEDATPTPRLAPRARWRGRLASIAPRAQWRGRLASTALLATAAALASIARAAVAQTPTSPPPLNILTPNGAVGRGDIFITPTGGTATYANGPEILDRDGHVVWFHAIPVGLTAADLRTQTYRGQPLLTFWQGQGFGGP